MKKIMKVILLQDVKGLGKRNDIKEVSVGYARNFLLPKNLVEITTPGALKRLLEVRAKKEEEKKVLIADLERKKEKIKDITLAFKVKVGKEGGVFGSISAKDIKSALEEKGILSAEAKLKKPLKELGEHQIEINLGEGIKADIKILIET